MADAGVFTYSAGSGFFLLLAVLLLAAWSGRLQGGLLLGASIVSALWCALLAYEAATGRPGFRILALAEVLRDAGWFAFLLSLLGYRPEPGSRIAPALRASGRLLLGLCVLGAALLVLPSHVSPVMLPSELVRDGVLFFQVLLVVSGLALVEQLYRNTPQEHRWAVKYLCFGLGGMFAYDLYLYSDTLLFKRVNPILWDARGAIQALIVPLIAVSAARNPRWSVEVFVSRHVVLHSIAVLGSGIYLLVMAAAGYYIRMYGGTWGGVAQVTFLFGAMLLLLVLLASGQLRAQARVFLSKHFFTTKYDYREEWLRFTHALSTVAQDAELRGNVVKAIAQIVESEGGAVWVRGHGDRFQCGASWNMTTPRDAVTPADAPFVRFLETKGWIVYLDEYREEPERYDNVELPRWFDELRDPWVVVPLMQGDELLGFVVVLRSGTPRELNWEDTDLLKTAGRDAASYLAVLRLSEALADARQFEAFNRLSAYIVHDLKNLIAQLSLVVTNARKYRDNPAFMQDAVTTVENATRKMNQLLRHLRQGGHSGGSVRRRVGLQRVLREVHEAQSARKPVPVLECPAEDIVVRAERERLVAVVGHIVQNAQEATPARGQVRIRLRRDGGWAFIEVQDTGPGMAPQFIAERLFKPFDTTKGNAGMGIGVYQSREFLRAQGGDIEVESEPGRGTLFRLRLPIERGAEDVSGEAPSNVEALG